MKRLALTIGLFLLITAIYPSKAYAVCGGPKPNGQCPDTKERCSDIPGKSTLCCSGINECIAQGRDIAPTPRPPRPVCDFAGDQKAACNTCMEKGDAAWTAIGCIPADPTGFMTKILGLGIGMAGGIAFILILFGGLQIIMSTGNPEKLNAGKELVTAAIAGLLMVIFSVFILKVIGVDILAIPGFRV